MTDSLFPLSLPIASIMCTSCGSPVDDALKTLPGVSNVVVNESAHRVHLSYDPGRASIKDMVRALEEVGYLVINAELTLRVRGMTCASCVTHVERVLQELPGVEDVAVELGRGTVRVRYVSGAVALRDMLGAVQEAGYEVEVRSDAGRH